MLSLAWRLANRAARALGNLALRASIALGGGTGPAEPGRLLRAAAIILPIAGLVAWTLPRLVLVMSPSIDAWLLRPAPGPIARGDFVMFVLSHPLAGPQPVNVTKQALCMPGEMLTARERPSRRLPGATDGWYYCGTRLLGISKPRGRDGRPLPHLAWGRKPIPPGFAFVGSASPDGFDSRYYGPVALARLTRMERIW